MPRISRMSLSGFARCTAQTRLPKAEYRLKLINLDQIDILGVLWVEVVPSEK